MTDLNDLANRIETEAPSRLPLGLREGEIPCFSCPRKDWECMPAVDYATLSPGREVPLCRVHSQWALIAGWLPIRAIAGDKS